MTLRLVCVAALVPAAAAGIVAAQAPDVTFRVEVNYVEESVRVVDADGGFVRGLKQSDFQVLEDGRAQKLQTFGVVDIPAIPPSGRTADDAALVEPDVADNRRVVDGRLYLLVLDDYHVAPLRTQIVKDLARQFVLEKLGPGDQAAVVTTSGSLQGTQEFTLNRRLLLQAIDAFMGQKVRSAAVDRITRRAREESRERALARSGDQPETPSNPYTEDADAPERTFKARAALRSLRNLAEWMSAVQGRRKAVIYISEGIDFNLYDIFVGKDRTAFQFETFNVIEQETWDTIAAASRSNVQIYPVDPRGLTTMAQEAIELSGQPLAGIGLSTNTLAQELNTSQMNLRQLAVESGGVAAVGTNDLRAALNRIVEENSSYYVLGYYSTNERRDGRLRNITIRVAGHPDSRVTYRKRYAAPRRRTSKAASADKTLESAAITSELLRAMATPLPRTGLQLRVTAVPRKGVDERASLDAVVEIAGRDLTFTNDGGMFRTRLSLSLGVFNKEGQAVISERPDAALNLRHDTHARIVENGLRVLVPLRIAPGQYQLRIAAQDSSKSRQGSVHLDLTVPEFSREALSLSGIALSATSDQSLYFPPRPGFDPFDGFLPGALTAQREFRANTEVAGFVEVYENRPNPVHVLDITTTIRAEDGRVVFTAREERSTEELHGTPGAFAYTFRVPLTDWPSGRYTLAVEAKPRVGARDPAARIIEFRVI